MNGHDRRDSKKIQFNSHSNKVISTKGITTILN